MATSSSSSVCAAQNTPSSAQREQKATPTDQRVQQLLEHHHSWEMLDDTLLAIIDHTYAALLDILGLAARPEGGGPVKVRQLVFDDAASPDSPASSSSPMLCVVEASARHCRVSLTDACGGGVGGWWEPKYRRFIDSHRLQPDRRASVRTSPGTVHLSRGDGGGGGQGNHMCNCKCAIDDGRPAVDVSGKGLLEVLDTMRSRLETAIQLESIVMRMASKSRCRGHNKILDSFRVRMALEGIRREVDLGAVMRRRRNCRDRENGRRRPAAEMDVDQVDEEDVLTKRIKAMHV